MPCLLFIVFLLGSLPDSQSAKGPANERHATTCDMQWPFRVPFPLPTVNGVNCLLWPIGLLFCLTHFWVWEVEMPCHFFGKTVEKQHKLRPKCHTERTDGCSSLQYLWDSLHNPGYNHIPAYQYHIHPVSHYLSIVVRHKITLGCMKWLILTQKTQESSSKSLLQTVLSSELCCKSAM